MIQVDPSILVIVLACLTGTGLTLGFLLGSWLSPAAKAARDEVSVWKGRYNAEVRYRAEAEALAGKNAPLGSLNGLEGLADMFLGGEKFSIPKLLGVLKENPEMIGQLLQLLKSGVPQAKPPAKPAPPGVGTLKQLG